MFGAVNALFSGLAFAGLFYAILLQRQELALQREELSLARQEMQGQRAVLEAQSSTLKKQNFEDTFFRMLGIQSDIVREIDIRNGGNVVNQGRDCFKSFFSNRFGAYFAHRPDREIGLPRLREAYVEFFEKNQADIGHYFRNLYTLIKFVDGSDVEDKRAYTNIVRAQLSSYEQLLLFYNCLTPLGGDFKGFVERYALLKHMPTTELLDQQHLSFYEHAAFD